MKELTNISDQYMPEIIIPEPDKYKQKNKLSKTNTKPGISTQAHLESFSSRWSKPFLYSD